MLVCRMKLLIDTLILTSEDNTFFNAFLVLNVALLT